jgi:hypothetical protein
LMPPIRSRALVGGAGAPTPGALSLLQFLGVCGGGVGGGGTVDSLACYVRGCAALIRN